QSADHPDLHFPYTTLFRSIEKRCVTTSTMPSNVVMTRCGAAIPDAAACAVVIPNLAVQIIIIGIVGEFHAFFCCNAMAGNKKKRSEEHTSELQSLAYLVCR